MNETPNETPCKNCELVSFQDCSASETGYKAGPSCPFRVIAEARKRISNLGAMLGHAKRTLRHIAGSTTDSEIKAMATRRADLCHRVLHPTEPQPGHDRTFHCPMCNSDRTVSYKSDPFPEPQQEADHE